MNIVVTGSKGFIGSHLVDYLTQQGHKVIGWDLKDGNNIKNFNLSSRTEMVIHLAALADVKGSIKEPELYWTNNVEYTKHIQDLCYDTLTPLIYASSSCADSWWLSPYGTTKKINEQTARPGQIGLRFTTVYGDGARENMFMSKLFNGSLRYSTNHIRDFIHVSDVITAINEIVKKPFFTNVYNIGTGVGSVVSELAKKAGYNVPVVDGENCEAQSNVADISLMEKHYSWKPKVNVLDYINNKHGENK